MTQTGEMADSSARFDGLNAAARRRAGGRKRRRHEPWWVECSDRELLDLRLCDLDLKIQDTPIQERLERLYEELAEKEIRLRPHVWFSHEWFSPDGIPGFGVPFYLAHDRLKRLELKMMLEVEGGTASECMKLMRHETGHCVCTAYRLHYSRRWRKTFGPMGTPYPKSYLPRAHSKRYVLHLDWWYAQAHPAEDFAETFAVWLKPNSRWRKAYRGWPALLKLRYVHDTMAKIQGRPALVRSKRHVEPLKSLRYTLREYYEAKRETYGSQSPDVYTRDLRRLFSEEPRHARRMSAAVFLRRHRRRIREQVSRWTGEYQYTVDLVLRDMIDRCKSERLRLRESEKKTLSDATTLVTVQTMNFLHRVPHRILV